MKGTIRVAPVRWIIALVAVAGAALGFIAFVMGQQEANAGSTPVAVERMRILERADGSIVVMSAMIDVTGGADPDAVMDELAPGWTEPEAAEGSVSAAYSTHGRWAVTSIPVPVAYNPAGEPDGVSGGPAASAAMRTWNAVSAQSFAFADAGTTSSTATCPTNRGTNVIQFGPLAGSVLGRACWVISGGFIDGFDITLSVGANWSTWDLESNILHELGHALGLNHASAGSSAVMAPALPANTRKRSPTCDDKAGMRELYPQGTPTDCGAPTEPGSPTATRTATPTRTPTRTATPTLLLLAGATGATAACVAVFWLLFSLIGPHLGPPLGAATEAVATAVLTPPLWLLEKIVRFVFSGTALDTLELTNPVTDSADQASGTGDEKPTFVERAGAYSIRAFALIVVVGLIAGIVVWFTRFRRRGERRPKDTSDSVRAGSLRDDLRGALGGLFGRRQPPPVRSSESAAQRLYFEVLTAAERSGESRQAHETPGEYAPRLQTVLRTPVTDEITAAFQQARYGAHEPDAAALADLQSRWRRDTQPSR